jgi:subtilase family serine protease
MIFRVAVMLGFLLCLMPFQVTQAASSGVASCAKPTAMRAGCFAKLLFTAPSVVPSGYSPAQLRAAYGAAGKGTAKIAVVDAYGDPSIKSDLDTYSRTFGLPVLPACTSAAQTACFEKTDQSGGQLFPRTNAGWALETALDVEAAHGICPGCRIELVQATSASISNLMAAVDQAVRSGAQIVSMSWGGSETSSELAADAHFQPSTVDFVASSGDSGYGTSWPAASSRVVAVGGTHLSLSASGQRLSEVVWAGSGSGCSKYETKPAWQHDPSCARRSIADIAAVADPATGAAVYSSLSAGGAGWFSVGGTSLAAPVVAGLLGLAGAAPQAVLMPRLYSAMGTNRTYDIVSGSNGSCTTYLCRGVPGYDGPTGIGTLAGLGALQ